MKKEINYRALMEEIRDVFLDEGRTTVKDESWYDDDGRKKSSFALECTKEQEKEAAELIRKYFADGVITVVEEIFKDE